MTFSVSLSIKLFFIRFVFNTTIRNLTCINDFFKECLLSLLLEIVNIFSHFYYYISMINYVKLTNHFRFFFSFSVS